MTIWFRHKSIVISLGLALLTSLLYGCKTSPSPIPTPVIGKVAIDTPTVQLPAITTPAITSSPAVSSLPIPTVGPYIPVLPVWGVELYYLGKDGGLDLAKQANAFWLRRNALLWSVVEPVEGQRKWEELSGLEKELQTASEQGLQVILVVRSTPEWAQSTPGSLCSAPKPEMLKAFGAFIKDTVRRYSVPPYNVQYWEISNEPDVAPELVPSDTPFGCWGKAGDPYYGGEYYAEILKEIYGQVKAANPSAQVLVGGLLLNCDPINPPETSPGSGEHKDCVPSRYLQGILKNGGANYFDGVSYHAYDYYSNKLGQYSNSNWNSAWNTTGPVLIAKAGYLRSILNQFGMSDKYLINSESAILCGKDGSEPFCQTDDFRLTKSYYLAQAYVSAIAEGLMANIWYSFTGWRGSGLLDNAMQPNDAYQAFKTSAEQLAKVSYVGPITKFEGVKGYAFQRGGAPIWVVWSLDGADHNLKMDKEPASVTDVFGAQIPASQDLKVTVAPVYIEFSK